MLFMEFLSKLGVSLSESIMIELNFARTQPNVKCGSLMSYFDGMVAMPLQRCKKHQLLTYLQRWNGCHAIATL